jgi:hypothetical protein
MAAEIEYNKGQGGLFYHRIVKSSVTFPNVSPWPGKERKE